MAVTLNTQNNVFDTMRSNTSRVAQAPTFTGNVQPETKTEPASDEVVMQNKTTEEPQKKKSLWQRFKNGYTNFKKAIVTTGEYIKGTFNGLAYGGIGAVGVIGVDAIRNVVKKAPKAISTKGKVIAGAVGLTVMAYHLFIANLNANAKKADIDHRWQTGHNE